jgi:isochorismate synthase
VFSTKTSHISTEFGKLEALWQKSLAEGYPVALWRLPKTNEQQLLIDLSGKTTNVKVDFEELASGFVISPFQGESLLLKADLYYRFDEDNAEIQDDFDMNPTVKDAFELKLTETSKKTFVKTAPKPEILVEELYNEMTFATMVSDAIEAIERGEMQKVVVSRTRNIILPESFSVFEAFQKLCNAYPLAFVSAVFLPQYNAIWLGATPETLVSIDKTGIFKTMSLAGTQSALGANGERFSPGEIRWSHKEIEEQAFVSRYIIECFKKIRLREYIESGPKTIQAGNLMHLRTDYSVDTHAVNFPQLGTVMTELLHPTSAVCGMPKEPALRFIAEHELHQREFYSGFLGPINIQEESHLFVNLRTMKIQNQVATLYAGCGITEDSNPTKEWQETEMKSQTLLSVLSID